MPRYSKDLTTYPSILYDYLRGKPREATIQFDSEREARNFQYRFWGLRAALREAAEERRAATIADQGHILFRAERTECTRQGARITFTPKELLTQTAELRIMYGREVDPDVVATEGDRIAREGERKLLAMLSAQPPQPPQPQASAPDYAQSLPTKTLAQVLEEQALRDDDD
ncbi:hypothetical protein [Microcystis phage Mel-JY34]